MGGTSRCTGTLEIKHQGNWRLANDYSWNLKTAAVVCRQLDCGSAVSTREVPVSDKRPAWMLSSQCSGSESTLGQCGSVDGEGNTATTVHEVVCSGNTLIISL